MITDTIANAARYTALHPDFADAVRLMQSPGFSTLPDGQHDTGNPNIRLFIGSEAMRSRQAARPEAHQKHIDIQIPLSGAEGYGWIDRGRLKNGLTVSRRIWRRCRPSGGFRSAIWRGRWGVRAGGCRGR